MPALSALIQSSGAQRFDGRPNKGCFNPARRAYRCAMTLQTISRIIAGSA